jgi:N-acetyl-gamma-glutamyl-phosphate reductase
VKAAVLGATGYTGLLLARLLALHPRLAGLLLVSSSRRGAPFAEVDRGFVDEQGRLEGEGRLLGLEEALAAEPEVVFSAVPHLESARLCAPFMERSVVIDLSADFRLRDVELFAASYGSPPPRPDLLDRAVYGLAEWNREQIRSAGLIANPGCYPTATLLPLLPLLREGLIEEELQISAISGVSGAGRKVRQEYLFCERSENLCAYAPGRTHRHVSEIESQLRTVAPSAQVLFVPHLAPLRKGMAVTTFARVRSGVGEQQVAAALRRAYADSPFIGLCGDRIPQTAEVRGTNRCDIGFRLEGRGLMLFSVLDNLVKGASGQAVQNMNLRFGFGETEGLARSSEI